MRYPTLTQVSLMTAGLLSTHMAQADEPSAQCTPNLNTQCEQVRPPLRLPPVTITANRVATELPRYTGQISVLEAGDLTSPNIIENLTQIPGFETGDDFGRQIGSQFKLRGFGYQSETRVIIEQDGVKRSPSLFSNHISSFRTDPNLLKRVEVVKGGSSVLHGSGAIGGIVSMTTKDAKDFLRDGDSTGVTLGTRYDSNNSRQAHIALAIDAEQAPVDFLVYRKQGQFDDITLADGGVRNSEDGSRIDKTLNDESIKNSFFKAGWDISDEQRMALSYYKYDEELETSWQTLWHRDPGESPVDGNLEQRDIILDYHFAPSGNKLINLSAKVYDSEAFYRRTRTSDTYSVFYINRDERQGFNLKNSAEFTTGSLKHSLVAGLDYEEREEDATYLYNNELSDFGSFPNYYKDTGLYAQDIIQLGKAEISLGGRLDRFKRGVDLPGRSEYKDSHFSPKIGVSYELHNGVYLLANYAETFRGPTPNETSASGALNPHYWYVPNNALKPEVAKEYEIGFALNQQDLLGDDSLYLKATWFDGDIQDMISLERSPELGTPPDIGDGNADYREYAQYKNIASASRRGFEVEAKYRLPNWAFAAGYDHLKLHDDRTGKLLQPSTDKLYLNASYTHNPWDLTAGVRLTHWFEPKRDSYVRVIRGEEYQYIKDDFTTVDLLGSWQPGNWGQHELAQDWSVKFGINNLFDEQRINAANYETTTAVGKGRNYYLALEKYF